jgi:hypothetical protein
MKVDPTLFLSSGSVPRISASTLRALAAIGASDQMQVLVDS